ncbi:MAG: DNA gyrase inhibitor YacG [Thiomonas sp.]|uniref:DNA gyrase inhibitor YacG n=1 Tax=Thiomonas sp. TaxID=2047785 RepID=UPI002A369211|nr:DNA gyrase inhibitor YacG [Thiomonas sp.]MDY0330517.1 DNA gyrase inhibitor YacG [Thiomonas sp.]
MHPQPPSRSRPKVRCPQCGTLTVYGPSNPWRPFCSERCKSIDFGAWASENYRVQAKPDAADIDALEQELERNRQNRSQPH